jgi:phenylalanyl-tRNA synthetase beta chain
MDIHIAEDIVEEVGRLYGYDKLPLELPKRSVKPAQRDTLLELKASIRETLSRAGANEVLTYSFIRGNLLDKIGQDKEKAFRLSNALSPDLQYYRLSLTPSLLEKVHPNIKAGYKEFAIFEVGKVHTKAETGELESEVPREINALALVIAADDKISNKHEGAPYYYAKQYLEALCYQSTTKFVYETLEGADLYGNPWIISMAQPFEPKRSAVLRGEDKVIWGVVGEYKASTKQLLKLPSRSAGFEIDPLLVLRKNRNYQSLSRFPKIEQDMTLRVEDDVPFEKMDNIIVDALVENVDFNKLAVGRQPLDIYQKKGDSHKNVTFRFNVASYERTLTAQEVNNLLDSIADKAKEELGAERV